MTHDPATCLPCGRDMPGLRCEHCGSLSRMVDAHPDLVPRGSFMVEPWRRPVVADPDLFTTPVKKGRPSNAEKARREAERTVN